MYTTVRPSGVTAEISAAVSWSGEEFSYTGIVAVRTKCSPGWEGTLAVAVGARTAVSATVAAQARNRFLFRTRVL
ncbi:hypothetical protein GCM10009676_31960 [Prauserella halophila]|uniref:Uncharacterized protein n=1 Tax=Prauserella halophila TaxID=185641 RepID=A0ABN1WF08_9PSEU